MRLFLVGLTAILASLASADAALAQPAEEGADKPPAEGTEDKKPEEGDKPVDKPAEKADAAPAAAGDPHDPAEDPGKAYRFIGLRFRNVIVPKFMVNIFADGGATVNAFTFGPEFTTRKDHLEINVALSFADYSMDPFMFKGKSDGDEAYEKVSSTMKLLYLTVDLLYEVPIDSKGRFAFLFGGGIGLAPVFGNLYRNQAYPKDPGSIDPDDAGQWEDCTGVGGVEGRPVVNEGLEPGKQYCDDDNDHFVRRGKHSDQDTDNQYDEPSWFNGGSKPSIMPWISLPQLSLRIKPIKEFQTRVDVGFSITGFFFGMNAGYALP
jgi:hypothetical protein